jgi:hypothetical protein
MAAVYRNPPGPWVPGTSFNVPRLPCELPHHLVLDVGAL